MTGQLKKIGVVGAGIIGEGVARSLAQTGHRVTLVDLNQAILDRAIRKMDRDLRLEAFSNPDLRSVAPQDILDRITRSTDLEDLRAVDFVIENVTEDIETKFSLYPRLDAICPPDKVFAANTSAIQIERLARTTRRFDRVIGLHFMNPVPRKSSVEMILPQTVSQETAETAQTLLAQMGKRAIVVGDSPGFVSNRLLMPFVNDAIALVHDGIASCDDIDQIFVSCMSHAMGPLATADLIGLDTILLTLEGLDRDCNDRRYAPHPLLREMVAQGKLGRKSGQGFFDYPLYRTQE